MAGSERELMKSDRSVSLQAYGGGNAVPFVC